ncbi:UNVERIFIED_CONTAM: tecpr1 [Trichonephila clavipes]
MLKIFSISSDAFDILLRTGVNSNELFGRTWKTLKVPLHDLNKSPSSSSLDSMSTISHRDSVFTSDSVSLNQSPQSSRKISTLSVVSSTPSLKSDFDNCSNLTLESTLDKSSESGSQDSGINHIQDAACNRRQSVNFKTSSFSSLDSESLYAEKTLMFQSTMEITMNQSSRNLMWIWISASGCAVNSESLPYWFSEASSISKSAIDELWYSDVVSQLKNRFKREVAQFSTYPRAIEQNMMRFIYNF